MKFFPKCSEASQDDRWGEGRRDLETTVTPELQWLQECPDSVLFKKLKLESAVLAKTPLSGVLVSDPALQGVCREFTVAFPTVRTGSHPNRRQGAVKKL